MFGLSLVHWEDQHSAQQGRLIVPLQMVLTCSLHVQIDMWPSPSPVLSYQTASRANCWHHWTKCDVGDKTSHRLGPLPGPRTARGWFGQLRNRRQGTHGHCKTSIVLIESLYPRALYQPIMAEPLPTSCDCRELASRCLVFINRIVYCVLYTLHSVLYLILCTLY